MKAATLKTTILKYDRPAPRYTSYPPAPLFSKDLPPDTGTEWLQSLTEGQTLSLYLHIPFCARLCYYCGCHTVVANHYERVHRYLEKLYREIDLAAARVAPGVRVTHLHFGGGSPTMLTDADFTALTAHLKNSFRFSSDAEIAIEADPRQLDAAKIENYARNGVTRISLGVQDFDNAVMEAVNRVQPYQLTADAVRLARANGIHGINFDLMYGLPHQTLETQRETFEKAINLAPDRIAFFGYAHVPWMKKHMDVIGESALPDPSLRYDLCLAGKKTLESASYSQVGIDHFVRSADPMFAAHSHKRLRRNFQGYTTDDADALLGFGASAISALPQGYIQNNVDLNIYGDMVDAGQLPAMRGIPLTNEDRARATAISDIMCYFETDFSRICRDHHLPSDFFAQDSARLSPLVADGLVKINGSLIQVAAAAPQITRIVAQAFDAYANGGHQPGRHSNAI